MILRFLGRIFLYFVIIPTAAPIIQQTFKNVLWKYIKAEIETMTPEQKKRYDTIGKHWAPYTSRR